MIYVLTKKQYKILRRGNRKDGYVFRSDKELMEALSVGLREPVTALKIK
jgi:hypothetical protein